jgi:hypothetical protein
MKANFNLIRFVIQPSQISSYVEASLGIALTSQIYHTCSFHRYLSLK